MKAMTRYNPPDGSGPGNHWRRFRRLVAIAAVAAVAAIAVALTWLSSQAPLGFHLALATALGVGGSVLLAGVLMALVFFSAHSGIDGDSGDSNNKDPK